VWRQVRQLDAPVAARLLVQLARRAQLLPGAEQIAYVVINDTVGRPTATSSRARGSGTRA